MEDEKKNVPEEERDGAVITENNGERIYCLTIIGQIEGHYALGEGQKATKYEHLIPLLVSVEQSEDVDGQLDWGTSEEEMWKDPKSAAAKIKEKLKTLKSDNFKLLDEVDNAIDEIYETWPKADKAVRAAITVRDRMLQNFHEQMLADIKLAGKTAPVETIKNMLKGQRGDTSDYFRTLAEAEEALRKTAAALDRAWKAELAYGNLFALKAAKKHGDKSLDDLDPGKGDDPYDPNIPPLSGPETGTDNDNGGESWTRGKPGEGWRQ